MAVSGTISNVLRKHGLKSRHTEQYQLPYCKTFYRVISNHVWDTPKHPNAARKKVCQIQENPDYRTFFEAFEPEHQFLNISENHSYNPRDVFEMTLKLSSNTEVFPKVRDIHAAAIYLNRQIHVYIIKDKTNMYFNRYGNIAHDRNKENPILILKTEFNDSLVYTEIQKLELKNDDSFEVVQELPHSFCHYVMFRTIASVSDLIKLTKNVYNCEEDLPSRTVRMHTQEDEFTLYRCIAKIIYDEERFYKYVKERVKQFKDDNLDVLSSVRDMLSNSNTDETTSRSKKTKNQKLIEDFFEALRICATLYTTDIYVYTASDGWSLFYPIYGFYGVDQTSSYITLQCINNSKYKILSTTECNCKLPRPFINKLSDVYADVKSTYMRKETCHPSNDRWSNHKHIASKREQEIREPYQVESPDLKTISDALKQENRQMDVVGTFEACIEKEKLGGKANISNIQRRVHEIDIQNAANDIGLPLYVFNLNRDMKWSRFIPVDQRRKQCRYYITLVRYARIKNGQEFDAFNRVTPDDNVPGCITCNCSMNPPLTDLNDSVEVNGFHNPRIEMFLDEVSIPKATTIRLKALHDTDVRKEILDRDDMKSRYLDEMESKNSFFACLSKTVFGTEIHEAVIQKKILDEIRNESIYTELICDVIEDHAIKVGVDLTSAKSKMGDILLYAAATFLQVDIYVLRLDAKCSFWNIYEKLRRVPFPPITPKYKSACDSFGDFYITIFEDHKQQYWRIVPQKDMCNCQIPPPRTKGSVAHKHNDHATLRYREICLSYNYLLNLIEENVALFELELVMLGLTIDMCERRRKNANIAIVVGGSIGLVGLLGYFSMSAALVLPGGAVMRYASSLTTSASNIADCVGTLMTKKITELINQIHTQKSEEMKRVSEKLDGQLKKFCQDNLIMVNIPNGAFEGRPILAYLRIANGIADSRAASLEFLQKSDIVKRNIGSVLQTIGYAVDSWMVFLAIRNMINGNRTGFSENQREGIKMIQFTKRMYQLIVDGNK